MCTKLFIGGGKAGILLLIGLLALSGCEHNDNLSPDTAPNYVKEETNTSDTETVAQVETESSDTGETVEAESGETEETAKTESSDVPEPSENLPEPIQIPESTEMEEFLYPSEDALWRGQSLHRNKSYGENIYFAYGEPYLGVMSIGSDKAEQADIDNPEGMVICHVAVDAYGRVHLIVTNNDSAEWFIWQLNESYQVEKVIDISGYFEVNQVPYWFLIDKDGTYYLQWLLSRDGVILDSEGDLIHRIFLKSFATRWTYEAAVGKNGRIYLVYRDGDEGIRIGEFDTESGTIKKEESKLCFSRDELFSEMASGTDTNLLLYSPTSGVWAFDEEKDILENRVKLSDVDLSGGKEFWPVTFLSDGRLLLQEKRGKDKYLRYIPAGK
ncbi:MAG: hypothetical protein NC543_07200 [bacterium]|nr:hypothetical protein [bacterium]MCM1375438.1 hypothetical protein [Muribaculum sp.]